LTSTCAFGGRPAGPFFADEHVVAVGQLEHSLLHSSSTVCFLVSFFVIGCLVKNVVLYSHQLFFACNKDVEMSAKKQGCLFLVIINARQIRFDVEYRCSIKRIKPSNLQPVSLAKVSLLRPSQQCRASLIMGPSVIKVLAPSRDR